MGRSFDTSVDPLSQIIAPPVNETAEQRRIRERDEAEARRISEQIDEALKAEREEAKTKRNKRLKVLLLGQSESGTLLFLFSGRTYPWSFPRDARCFSLHPPSSATRISNFVPGLLLPIEFRLPPFRGVCAFAPMSPTSFSFTELQSPVRLRSVAIVL